MDRLIDHTTGEIDQLAVIDAIKVDAAREWGGPDYPPRYERKSEQWVKERAANMRRAWLEHNGREE